MDCAHSIARRFLASHTGIDVQLWPQAGFSGAAIWQVHTTAGTYCLRRWPEEGLPAARIRALHHFLHDLAERGIDIVPVPLVADDGSTLLWQDVAWWQVEPWMPGRADFSSQPSNDRLRNIMHAVAGIHRAAAQYQPDRQGQEWFAGPDRTQSPNGRERMRLLQQWDVARAAALMRKLYTLPDDDLKTLAEEVLLLYGQLCDRVTRQVLEPFSRTLPMQVCLRDLWHDHVLLSGDEVTGVIDLSAARRDHVATDLARLLGSLVGDDGVRREQALDWYAERRPLSLEDRQMVTHFDQSAVLLSGLLWVERITGSGRSPGSHEAVKERLREFRNRMRTLADRG